jgi:hypothetical protein
MERLATEMNTELADRSTTGQKTKTKIFLSLSNTSQEVVDHAFDRMRAIQEQLAITHQLTYQYEFVWENWRLKDAK